MLVKNYSLCHTIFYLILSCRENCAWKRRLSSHMILDTICHSNCETKFGSLHFSWSMQYLSEDNQWEEYTNLDTISLTGDICIDYANNAELKSFNRFIFNIWFKN